MGRTLIIIGLVLMLAGVAWTFGERFGLGHLPGDIIVKGERYIIHFPIVTSIVISVALTALLWIINRMRN